MRMLTGLVWAVLFLIPVYSFGGDSGHGGGGWECTDANGKKTVTLLDLWEAADTDLIADGGLPMPANFDVNGVLARAHQAYGEYGRWVSNIYKEIHVPYDPVMKAGFWRPLRQGVSISFPGDAYASFQKKGCAPVGLALFDDDRNILWIDTTLLGEMSPEQQDALFFHEALYFIRRSFDKDTDSRAARKLLGYLYSALPGDATPAANFYVEHFDFLLEQDLADETGSCHLQLRLKKYLNGTTAKDFIFTFSFGPTNTCVGSSADFFKPYTGTYKLESSEIAAGPNLRLNFSNNDVAFYRTDKPLRPLGFTFEKDLAVSVQARTENSSLSFDTIQSH